MIEKVRHKGLALTLLAAAQFMVVLDATIVNVALPAIQHALHFKTDSDLQWVITAYALVFGGFLMLGGRLADLFGRRKVFLAGITLFALASLAGGLAQNPGQIILFRALQGLGGALLSPSALSLVLTIFSEGKERNRALGVWGMVAAGGGAVGLLLGGALTQYVDWRWIFFINVPVAIITFIASMAYVPKSLPQDRERVDVLGAIGITGSLMSVVYALAKAASLGWGSAQTITWFVIAIVLMAGFIFNELKVKHPLIDLSIFRRRNVTGGTLMQLLMPAAAFGMFFYMSIYLQQILGYSPVKTGLANLPFTLTIMLVASQLSSRISRINAKIPLVVGPLLAAAGLLYFTRMPIHAHYWTDIFPGIVVMAAGMASVFVTATIASTNGISHKDSGLVSGLLNTGQQIGGAIGLAVLTVISTSFTKHEIAKSAGDQSAILPATVHGFQHGYMAAAVIAIVASVVAATVFKLRKMSAQDRANQLENEDEALAAIPGA